MIKNLPEDRETKSLIKNSFLGRRHRLTPHQSSAFRIKHPGTYCLRPGLATVRIISQGAGISQPPDGQNFATLTFTPGPIVLASVMLLRYCPFSALGLALTMASIRALKFS